MQSVLFTVFRADSVEKINIWVATLRVGLNQHTQLQRLATILKLCLVSLPHGAVGLSGVCHRGIF